MKFFQQLLLFLLCSFWFATPMLAGSAPSRTLSVGNYIGQPDTSIVTRTPTSKFEPRANLAFGTWMVNVGLLLLGVLTTFNNASQGPALLLIFIAAFIVRLVSFVTAIKSLNGYKKQPGIYVGKGLPITACVMMILGRILNIMILLLTASLVPAIATSVLPSILISILFIIIGGAFLLKALTPDTQKK